VFSPLLRWGEVEQALPLRLQTRTLLSTLPRTKKGSSIDVAMSTDRA
jgi:hypothetical protein